VTDKENDMDPIIEAMYADTCPYPPPPQAWAFPEPTPEDLAYADADNLLRRYFASGLREICSLIRLLAAAERDRDDARRRVSELEKAGNSLFGAYERQHRKGHIFCDCGDGNACDNQKLLDQWEQAFSPAPGTGGTTGGGE
jgi:hypothetical protein